MTENRFHRYIRYGKYLLQWIFFEKIRGLDFTMRDTSLVDASGGVLHGYCKTDEKHAKEILEHLDINKDKHLLDVGCGKGAFLRIASKEPFGVVAGIEYLENIAQVARINFERLGLSDRVKIYHGDAASFRHYGDYNVFYFFNPFDAEIMESVMQKIVDEQKEKSWIILHNPVCAEVIEKMGGIETDRMFDSIKSYETRIYEIN